ncbi:dienelactone hydrolase [Scheffersomyces xylosifermentans]|uniref:dienelactone hydrolase n=1 Tax=Scheffersomyces xylosifermentans TaxID=1304137 RepID=UPI00315C8BC4
MASNPPGACCAVTNFHEGKAVGSFKTLFGVDSYQTGEAFGNDRVIVILTDVFGHKYNNVLLVADELAKAKYHVVIPDLFGGDPYTTDNFSDFNAWLPKHTPDTAKPIVDKFVAELKAAWNPKFLGGIGYCYGGKFAIQQLSEDGHFTAAAVAHPSFVSIEEVQAVKRPLLISAAETDSIFTVDLRHQTEVELTKLGARYQLDFFSGVEHGYAVRGDISKPIVKYAKEKTLSDQLVWFAQF